MPRWKHLSARQADAAITIQTALRMIIAPTVLISNAPPRTTWIPNAMNTAIVATAIAADSWAAQRLHKSNPKPAITYAKPATKLNQRTKGTILPTAALPSAPPNRVFPPTIMVTMPNVIATRAGIAAQCGRRGVVLFRTYAFAGASSVVNPDLGVVQCARYDAFCARAMDGRSRAVLEIAALQTSTVDPKLIACTPPSSDGTPRW